MNKIILDTDPGIDDAIALCYALNHPTLDVLALTTIYGNVAVDLATQNALRLVELNLGTVKGATVPVATGASNPLEIAPNPVADFVHGANGFGEIQLPKPSLHAASQSAAELIVDLIHKHPGEITLVAVGPLSNIALALELSPDIATLAKEVVVMGGAFHREGNVTPHAEANIWNDPHAAQQVFTAEWPLTVHGLDVTYQISFSPAYLDQLAEQSVKVGSFLRDAAKFYIKFYKKQHNFDGCCPHDQLALSYITHPEWYTLESGALDVVTEGESIGKTTIEPTTGDNKGNKFIATAVDRNALLDEYAAILSKAI